MKRKNWAFQRFEWILSLVLLASLVIVILTCIAGVVGTLLWWDFADQTH